MNIFKSEMDSIDSIRIGPVGEGKTVKEVNKRDAEERF